MAKTEVLASETGAVFRVKAHAGAKRNRVAGVHDGALKVEVTTAPEKGKANKAILKLLATALDLPVKALRLVAGETSPQKKIEVDGLCVEDISRRLERLIEEGEQ